MVWFMFQRLKINIIKLVELSFEKNDLSQQNHIEISLLNVLINFLNEILTLSLRPLIYKT